MSDKKKLEFLETIVSEILKINEDAVGAAHSIDFELALEGDLLERWKITKKLAEEYLYVKNLFEKIDTIN